MAQMAEWPLGSRSVLFRPARIDAVAPFIAACSVPCRRQLCARSLRTCRRMLVSATSKATAHCSKGDLYSGPTLRCHNAAASKFLHRGIRIARNATSTAHSRYAATSSCIMASATQIHSWCRRIWWPALPDVARSHTCPFPLQLCGPSHAPPSHSVLPTVA